MTDQSASARAHAIFDPIAQQHFVHPGVDLGRMFGTEGLRVRGKVYAFIGSGGRLIVKLPAPRVQELVAAGEASPMIMREREMREWVTVEASDASRWEPLIDEARIFLDEITH